jgi:predicted GNAT family acetyltransferase
LDYNSQYRITFRIKRCNVKNYFSVCNINQPVTFSDFTVVLQSQELTKPGKHLLQYFCTSSPSFHYHTQLNMENQPIITNNEKQLQFEYREGNELAYLEYRFYKNDIAFMHTLVPESMGGKGIASALARYAFDHAKKLGKPVMVYCPFVSKFLKNHPEYTSQLDQQYRG